MPRRKKARNFNEHSVELALHTFCTCSLKAVEVRRALSLSRHMRVQASLKGLYLRSLVQQLHH